MSRVSATILFCLLAFLCMITCSQKTQERTETKPDKELTMENLIKEAHSRYDTAITEGKTKEQAVKIVVEFLESQKSVKEIKVTSSDTLRVIFTNNEEVLLLLGRSRL